MDGWMSHGQRLYAGASCHCFRICAILISVQESSMADTARIVLDPAVLAGKPVIRGTRLSVDFIIGLLADGWTEADIFRNYPGVTHEDIAACLAYARDVLKSEKVYPAA
jgi:uncharacterized protein (DUF433 family)